MVLHTRISACGLNCRACDILLMPDNPEILQRMLGWFRREKWIGESEGIKEVIAKKMYWKGCGDKEVFWGGDCEVAKCCKNTKNLSDCSECSDFPCEKYNKWLGSSPPGQGEKYKEACKYLQRLKDAR
jgi:hypothetical protein